MFEKSCKSLLSKVKPIVIAWRVQRGKVGCGIGAGMFINQEGWFVTAGHILDQIVKLYEAKTLAQSKSKLRGNDVTDCLFMFDARSGEGFTAHVMRQIDIGIGKLDGVVPPRDHEFPKFRVQDVEQGELLCRAGYPFLEDYRPKWTAEAGFQFSDLFPVPMFVNEALVSRFLNVQTQDKDNVGIWIETSSPGLKGQSGGPLADANGHICGIQVNTGHYPLGYEGQGRNQVLNVGRAVHSKTLRAAFDSYKISYSTEET